MRRPLFHSHSALGASKALLSGPPVSRPREGFAFVFLEAEEGIEEEEDATDDDLTASLVRLG